jgi:hypothetical protein
VSRASLLLALLCACGKVSGADAGSGALPDSAGAACVVDAGALALALQSPPACASPDPDGGSNAACQEWADSLVSGAKGSCNGGLCLFSVGLGETCTPGSDGDARCQAWLQSFAKTSFAYGRCQPRGPNDPGVVGDVCVAADQCTIDSQGYSECTCGAASLCRVNLGELCVDVGSTPTCANMCE